MRSSKNELALMWPAWATALVFALALFLLPSFSHAVHGTWDGGGTDNYWSTSNNWLNAVLPVNQYFIFKGTTRTTTTNDFAAGRYIWELRMQNTVSGQSFTLDGNRPNIHNAIRTSAVASGNITDVLNMNVGAMKNAVIAAGHDVVINGVITYGSLAKSGVGTLILNGNNTYVGVTTVTAGKLLVNGTNNNQAAYIVTNTATLGGSGTIGLNNTNITICGGATIAPGDTNTAATLTVNGDFVFGENAVYDFTFGAKTGDTVTVSGNVQVPSLATVNITELDTERPKNSVLFSASSLTGATDLTGWTVNDTSFSYKGVKIDGSNVVLIEVPRSTTILID